MSSSETEAGRELVAEWRQMDTCLAEWILTLADFDRDALWAIDGFTNCVSWLEIKCEMSRRTAFEKVRVGRELTRRSAMREAFASGQLPYSKARVLTRLEGLDEERDETFIAAAGDSSMRALEMRVQNWNYHNGRDKRSDLDDHYGLRRQPGFMDGLGRLVLEAPNDMLDRVIAIVDAYGNFLFHSGPKQLRLELSGPADECPMDTHPSEEPKRPTAARRLDLFLDLMEEVALVNDDKLDSEIASIGITIAYEDLIANRRVLTLTDQESTLTGEAVRRLACDAGIHRMVVRGVSEFLDIGRKTRTWTTAQRRAIRARHNHRCAAAGCNRRITHIHHLEGWENGGTTAIDNGVPLCSYHHHLVHEGGWTISWNPNTGVTRMVGPEGQILETTVRVGKVA